MYNVQQSSKTKMKLEEIFTEAGWYVGDDFGKGVCFEVTENGELYQVVYASLNDIKPVAKNHVMLYKNLFNKNYRRVYNKKQLF